MAGKVLGTVLLVGFLVQAALFGVTYRMQLEEIERVDRVSCDFLWTVRDERELNKHMVAELGERLNRREGYQLDVWISRQVAPGIYGGPEPVSGEALRPGDRVMVNVEGERPGMNGRFLLAMRLIPPDDSLFRVRINREVTV